MHSEQSEHVILILTCFFQLLFLFKESIEHSDKNKVTYLHDISKKCFVSHQLRDQIIFSWLFKQKKNVLIFGLLTHLFNILFINRKHCLPNICGAIFEILIWDWIIERREALGIGNLALIKAPFLRVEYEIRWENQAIIF